MTTSNPEISDEAFAALRARLETKQEEFIKALRALSSNGAPDGPGSVTDHMFRLLGVVTFWLSTENRPSESIARDVHRALDHFTVKVVDAH